MSRAQTIQEAAAGYAARGIPVLPLYGIKDGICTCGKDCGRSAGKHPHTGLVPAGLKDASIDPEQVGRWFRAYPDQLNIGIVLRDLVAIDEDAPGSILAAGLELPNGPVSRTGRGHHYLFKLNGQALLNGRFAPGLDCKTGEAYIVAPPSLHQSGKLYTWTAGHSLEDVEPVALPGAVERLIVAAHAGTGNGSSADGLHDFMGLLIVEKAFRAIEEAEPTGNGDLWRRLVLQIIASVIGRMRDHDILSLCRRATWRSAGYTHEQTDEFVRTEIKRARAKFDRPEPSEDEDGDSYTVDSEKRAATGARLRLVPPSEMDWRGAELNLVKGLLGHGMMALLYGESGSAKTLIALSLALHVALGRDWCGRAVKRGFVAYLAPEGGHSVHLRFHAWCRHHGVTPTDNMPFRTIPVRVDLSAADADVAVVIANIKALEPELGPCVLAVVDTVSRALAGADENSPQDMGLFVGNCDRLREETGATVMGVHHTPRGGSTPRGHSSLQNGSEVRLLATKVATGLFSLKLEHLKDGEAGDELMFDLHSVIVGKNADNEDVAGGLVVRSGLRTDSSGGGNSKRPTDRQLRILQELKKETAATKRWEFTTDHFNDLCERSGAVDHDKADNIKRARCSDLKMQLANRGWITVNGDTIRLVIQ